MPGCRLDTLTIKGYKSILSLEDFELRDLNILIGANGSGKSNFLSFFRLLRAVIDGSLNDFIRSGGGVSDFLFNGRKTTSRLDFSTRFGMRGYRFSVKPGAGEECYLVDEARYYEPGNSRWWSLGDSHEGESRLVAHARSSAPDSRYSKPVYHAIASWQVYHFHDTGEQAPMRHAEIVQDNRRLRYNAANAAAFLLRLREEDEDAYRQIREAVRTVMPFFDDFGLDVQKFGPKEKVALSWRQKGSDYPMQPYHLSDGSIRFICLASTLLQPDPPSTVIIDEPELGLHPAAISLLAELIRHAATKTQLIVATQSPALVDQFGADDVIVARRKEGASVFERLSESDYSAWLETYSLGELWSKNVIQGGPVYE